MSTARVIYERDLRTVAEHLPSGVRIVSDAPVDNQGKGEAFSPTDIVATSLAQCMMTIMGIAGRMHDFSIDGAEAVVTKVMSSNPRRIAEIKIELRLPQNAYSNRQKKILEHISRNCPVALSLHPELQQTVSLIYL